MIRNHFVVTGVVAAAIVGSAAVVSSQQPAARPATTAQANKVVVYKSPTCTCCGAWIAYMRANGFTVEVHEQEDMTSIKRGSGVPEALESCHTAQVGGYAIEGHVPVGAIRRMLRERPAIAGLAVPGMVAGTPGMEIGNQHPPYEVKSFTRDGRTAVYERR